MIDHITPATLQRVYACPAARARAWAPHVAAALALAECTTRERIAAWLAQIGHESGGLRYVREIWGPTPQQLRYEPGTTLAARLGNTQPGDGALYMGRGLIQITGRANYRDTTARLRDVLGTGAADTVPDFEADPQALELPTWAALSAGLFWRTRKLNRWADVGDFAELTRRINGGYNGLAHRQALLARALVVLPGGSA